jgi:hypothetical protein
MNNIDDQIRKALAAEGQALAGAVGEQQGLFDLIGRSFQGKMKSLIVFSWVAMFAWFAFAVFSAVKLFGATDINAKINWGVGVIVAVQFLAGMKMWYFLELTKLATARDIRRLELRLTQTAPTDES